MPARCPSDEHEQSRRMDRPGSGGADRPRPFDPRSSAHVSEGTLVSLALTAKNAARCRRQVKQPQHEFGERDCAWIVLSAEARRGSMLAIRRWSCFSARSGHRFSRIKLGVSAEPYDPEHFQKTHRNWFTHPDLVLFEQIARRAEREPEPRSLIDVGCGNSNLLRYLPGRLGPKTTLAGIDLSANKSSEYQMQGVLSASLDRQFSIVVSLATIEHIPDVRSFTRRLRSLTKPNGLAIVMTLNDDSLLYRTARLLNRVGIRIAFDRLYSRHHLHHFSRSSSRSRHPSQRTVCGDRCAGIVARGRCGVKARSMGAQRPRLPFTQIRHPPSRVCKAPQAAMTRSAAYRPHWSCATIDPLTFTIQAPVAARSAPSPLFAETR